MNGLQKRLLIFYHNTDEYSNGTIHPRCICSHIIKNDCYLINKKSGRIYIVGCCCVEKVSKVLHDQVHKHRCKYCHSMLIDRKSAIRSQFFCDELCKINHYKMKSRYNIVVVEMCIIRNFEHKVDINMEYLNATFKTDKTKKKPLCLYCDEPLLNKRLDIQKDGFCDSQCKHHDEFFNETEMKTVCNCGEFCTVYETTKGINQGKHYYKCSKGFKGCDFWKWV